MTTQALVESRGELGRMGRQDLLDWIHHLEKEIQKTEERAVQRIAELEAELRVRGIVLPGWDCPLCKGFNGEAKVRFERCRCCDAPRPSESPA